MRRLKENEIEINASGLSWAGAEC